MIETLLTVGRSAEWRLSYLSVNFMSTKIVQVGQGKSVSLPCIASTSSSGNHNDLYIFEWTKNGQIIYSGSSGEDEGYPAHKYKGRLKHEINGALNFKDVIPDDQGVYLCTVKYMNKPARIPSSTGIHLVVNKGPKVVMKPPAGSTILRKIRQQVKLECVLEDTDQAKVEWFKDKRPLLLGPDRIQFHNKYQVLLLKDLQHSDAGHYGCLVSNIFGETYKDISLILSIDVHFREPLKNQTAQAGRQFTWHCQAFGQPENITYEWLFNDRKLPFANGLALRSIQKNGTLLINPVTMEDAGKFTCLASNGYGKATSFAFLDVQYHPRVVIQSTPSIQYLGENVTNVKLNCYFDSNPPLFNVKWSKEGRTLTATKHRFMHFASRTVYDRIFHAWLEFKQVHAKDAGQYSCQAYNSAGASDIFEIYAVIAKPPHFTRIPPQSAIKRQADTLEVTCDGESSESKSPQPHKVKIYWRKKPTVIDKSTEIVVHSKTLRIRSVSYKDHGCYECILENEVASLTSEMCLIVNDTPPQPPVNVTIQSSCCDSTVSWYPGHNGGHRQWFVVKYREKLAQSPWHVVNMTENRFTALNLIPSTSYEYVIQPYNVMGQGHAIHISSRTEDMSQGNADRSDGVGQPQNLTVLFLDDRLRFSWFEDQSSDSPVRKTYILEYRKSNLHFSSERNKKAAEKQLSRFEPLMKDILENQAIVHPQQPPMLGAGLTYDFRVRSKIPSTGWLSEPSNVVKYHLPDFSDQESTVLAAIGGSSLVFVISLVLIAILFAATRHKNVKHCRERRHKGLNGTACQKPEDQTYSGVSNGYHYQNKIDDEPNPEQSPSDSFLLIEKVQNGDTVSDQEERNSIFPDLESTYLAMFPYSRESQV